MNPPKPSLAVLFEDIESLIGQTKQQLAVSVNSTMSLLYWKVGQRINEEVDIQTAKGNGKGLVKQLAAQLNQKVGRSFSEKNLRRMMQFARVFSEQETVVSLIRHLSWTHIIAILPIEDPLKRKFYIEMCKHERWSVRTFRERINSMLYERTAISRKPEQTVLNELEQLADTQMLTPDLVFRDPYLLDFLELKDTYSERDLENSILAELQRFIVELGSDFAFLARQKRITIDDDDYYIDLLFYHRRLACLVAMDLKLGKFEAGHKGQMELYLRWLEKHEMMENENLPIGLVLCADKNEEHVELLQLDRSNIRVAEYFTKLPNLKLLENKLIQAIEHAKNRLGSFLL